MNKALPSTGIGLVLLFTLGLPGLNIAEANGRPNFVFFLVDDLRHNGTSVTGHPFGQTPNIDRIANEGIRFNNAFVTTSLCSPSRASLLTGKYIWAHEVLDNKTELSPSQVTFPQLLQVAGYNTAFVGKWHMGTDPNPRQGFDYWVSFAGQGEYFDPTFNVNGQTVYLTGYNTDLLTDYAEEFLGTVGAEPFLLYLSYKAVHGPLTPATRHENLYLNDNYPVPPSGNADPAGKPADVQQAMLDWQAKTPEEQQNIVNDIARKTQRVLAAVDESVERIFNALSNADELDNTVLVFISDNGYFFREFGLTEKRRVYEPSIRIPWLVRYPTMIAAGRTSDLPIFNVDLAPTFLDLAGVSIPSDIQGRSLRPIFEDSVSSWRGSWFAEYVEEQRTNIPTSQDATMMGVLKYIYYLDNPAENELYDLSIDPEEITNVIGDSNYAAQLTAMVQERQQLINFTRPMPPWPYAHLGTVNRTWDLQLVEPADGDTEPVSERGHEGRKTLDPNQDHYMYFDIADTFAYQGSRSEVYISISYYDSYYDGGSGSLVLQYDAADSAYQDGDSISLTTQNKWKTYMFHVTDAYFGNRQNGEADFRIARTSNGSFCLDVVQVRHFDPDLPAFAHNPDPAHQAVQVATDAILSWSAAGGTLSHNVYFGTANPPLLQGNQSGVTFNPGGLQVNTKYYWRVDEVKESGITQGRIWQFTSARYKGDMDGDNDVDQEDFGLFQACFSGTGVYFESGCEYAELDGDNDVDLSDFTMFQSCMAGPNQPPGC
ncbi:MAG: sulfatase-like hydrolase/transferase [Planctomycetota bacterium]|nr:MAG: sulfatase-like hydrolase/transferase [Planctomycetota bacterium]